MLVSEVMTTRLVTVTPDATLSHAANLLRQHQFHHLPIVRANAPQAWLTSQAQRDAPPVLEGLLTASDIDLAVARSLSGPGEQPRRPWEEVRVGEVMQRAVLCVLPTTDVATAATLLVERGITSVPVVEYGEPQESPGREVVTYLIGLLTRSDLLLAMARALGASEPGSEVRLPLPGGTLRPVTTLLLLAARWQIAVQSLIITPLKDESQHVATVRLGTINPGPLLAALREAGIAYESGARQYEEEDHAR